MIEADALRRFIVYGTLAPGRPNHHLIAMLPGRWHRGWITGDLEQLGWGAAQGYPVLRWRDDGPRVDAWLLESDELPEHWSRLDEFEGPEYQRSIAPFHHDDGHITRGCFYGPRHTL